jgi:hypothetical protein
VGLFFFLFVLFVFLTTAELLLLRYRPRWVVPLARIPVPCSRSIALQPRAMAALAVSNDGTAGYREPIWPPRALDLARLRGAAHVERDGYEITFVPERACLLVRDRNHPWARKSRPVVRVDLRPEGERIDLRAYVYPPGLLAIGVVAAVVSATTLAGSGGSAFSLLGPFMLLVVPIAAGVFAWTEAQKAAAVAVVEVDARVVETARLGGVRVADLPAGDAIVELGEPEPQAEPRRRAGS